MACRGLLGVAAGLVACLTAATLAYAAGPPETPRFDPEIEPLRDEDDLQETCTYPSVLEGTREFGKLLVATYPDSSIGGYARKCHIGEDPSEHKEGRALDWMMNAFDEKEHAQVDEVIAWLFATDEHGNEYALFRRLGLMYIIWDRQKWGIYRRDEGWRPHYGDPHTNHVHFSFYWEGARKETSWWTGNLDAIRVAAIRAAATAASASAAEAATAEAGAEASAASARGSASRRSAASASAENAESAARAARTGRFVTAVSTAEAASRRAATAYGEARDAASRACLLYTSPSPRD